ncbi:MAG: type II toxin-antitoxin system RelE/ParE family toxin [Methyloceanibacter sp.]
MKPIVWCGNSLEQIREFPDHARRLAGHQLDKVQRGLDPDDWKPMPTVGLGVREIRVRAQGQFRVVYLAKFEEAVYVLHAFAKKTQRTARQDLEVATTRFRELREERRRQ